MSHPQPLRRSLLLCAGVVAGLASIGMGATIVSGGPFTLPTITAPPKDIYEGPASRRVGARVRTTTGRVRVDATKSGTTTGIGTSRVGIDALFEGNYDRMVLVAVEAPAEGQWETLEVPSTGADRYIGGGYTTLPAQAQALGFYASDAPNRRLVTMSAAGGAVGIRSVQSGPDLVTVDAGDWSFALVGNATRCFASGAAATGTWAVYAVHAACGPFEGAATGVNGDTDAVSFDGSASVRLVLHNPGPATVRVTRALAGGSPSTVDVAPGAQRADEGNLASYSWAYVDGTPGRQTTVTLALTVN